MCVNTDYGSRSAAQISERVREGVLGEVRTPVFYKLLMDIIRSHSNWCQGPEQTACEKPSAQNPSGTGCSK